MLKYKSRRCKVSQRKLSLSLTAIYQGKLSHWKLSDASPNMFLMHTYLWMNVHLYICINNVQKNLCNTFCKNDHVYTYITSTPYSCIKQSLLKKSQVDVVGHLQPYWRHFETASCYLGFIKRNCIYIYIYSWCIYIYIFKQITWHQLDMYIYK
jgi:hypothetical protein